MTALPILRHQFTVPVGQLAALYCAPPADVDRKACVVLVGGLAGSKEDFNPLLPLLGQAGYHAYAYDHRGQYESDGPTDPAAYTVQALGEDLHSVLFQVKHPNSVHLVALCVGGFVAHHASEGLGAAASLALVGCPLSVSRGVYWRLRAMALVGWLMGPTRTAQWVIGHWEKSRPRETLDPATQLVASTRLTRTRPGHLLGVVRSWAALRHRGPITATPLPTLIMNGAKDGLFPARDFTDAARRLGAAHVVIADAGHNTQQHQPQAVTQALLHFWNSLPSAPNSRRPTAPSSRPGHPGAARRSNAA
ncbi:alpha/beta fold hydrolase (plasmid) [Streptomyces sp. CA-294286]|uniref:alpha/beta fold hydrolase n=1 Tax=Streptomyces sp. CA-294286 TaxID=3240070 RepID=UPI003D8DE699